MSWMENMLHVLHCHSEQIKVCAVLLQLFKTAIPFLSLAKHQVIPMQEQSGLTKTFNSLTLPFL